ncbi:MAG: glycosyltransferase family 4 protein [Paracoccus sp. (in: a-proteobacteria)]|uniref:glycosyltransferase family 4 protein n=1 Tax=Paracoccus sp. TaxID=267 RepID=UPI0026E06E36|nr:glycosyltransferase family 4 protein [Paracoccus sp. (in: a-proteobacteria)]MDO5622656.1 glycosyltransferase family 4 protein [Paracoccus sp. (in: a-proteobacteria)]
MQNDPRQAAIYFASDGYDPAGKGINGRRVAGESFLRGWLAQSGDGPVRGVGDTPSAMRGFRDFVQAHAPGRPVETVLSYQAGMAQIGTLFYPSPGLAGQAWARMRRGQGAWSICGITHTISTRAVMEQIAQMVFAPLAPWDALVLTSRAVRSAVESQLAQVEDYARRRFGGVVPARVMLPVIPLGVHVADFAPDPAAGAGLRARLGLAEGDILVMTLARLSFAEKFDPLPVFIGLQQAAQQFGGRLHYALVGQFSAGSTQADYQRAAAQLAPDVVLHFVDGGDLVQRKAALSGADMFLFPIDNIQETFGLAPVEAMAAGLPVIATDWDGLRDTVTPDCGILIPTLTGRAEHSRIESLRFLTGTDSYHAFLSLLSGMSSFDPQVLAQAVLRLAQDAGLRARMGAAGQRRARQVFDWAAVVPQMQDLWAEQSARRQRDAGLALPPADAAVLPSGFSMFAGWPSDQLPQQAALVLAPLAASLPSPDQMAALGSLPKLRRGLEAPAIMASVLAALTDQPQQTAALARQLGLAQVTVERVGLWLVKYGYARLAG